MRKKKKTIETRNRSKDEKVSQIRNVLVIRNAKLHISFTIYKMELIYLQSSF